MAFRIGVSRRQILAGFQTACLASLLAPVAAWAGPFDSLELDRRARVLKQGPMVIPAASGAGPGAAGADILAPRRGFVGIDWVITGGVEVTIMLVTATQKAQLTSGRQPNGDPLMRFDVKGPETAGQNAQVGMGNYYVAFLNRAQNPARVLYRASFLPF